MLNLNLRHPIFFYLPLFLLFFHVKVLSKTADNIADTSSIQMKSLVHIGAVLDVDSPEGAVAEKCISMAVSEFYAMHPHHRNRLVLHTRSSNDLASTAAAVVDLLKNVKVHAILGPQMSDAAPLAVELGAKAHVPIISFFPTSPTLKNPYFIQASQDDSYQIKAIATTLQRFGRHEVVLVYEDTNYCKGMISYLVNALHELDIRVAHMSAIPPSAEYFQISKEFNMLIMRKNRVFIVHMMTSSLKSRLFALANKAGMMSEGNIWLMTATSSNSLNVMDPRMIDSMKGVWGIRSHVPKSKDLKSFKIRWKRNLHLMDLNIFGLWAYDSIWALAMAVERLGVTNLANTSSSRIGPRLVREMLNVKFKGLSGEFQLVNGQLKSEAFEIFNVIGKKERVVGYWSPNKRVSRRLLHSRKSLESSSTSSNELRNSIRAGDSTIGLRGSAIPHFLRIGIPVKKGFKEFVNQKKNPHTNETTYHGFSIEVFLAALKESEFSNIPYNFFPYENEKGEMNGTYDDLLYQLEKGNYDVVVGDTTIVANRTYYVDFTLPYSESSVTMLVAVKHGKHRNTWIFLQPWSWDLWLAVIASFIFMGLIIQIMECQVVNVAFAGSRMRQLGMTIWWPFSALAIPQRELVVNDWSRFVLAILIGFAVILMQIYTASLSSMLTVDQLQPTFDSVDEIRTKHYKVGYANNSFVEKFLTKQLNFTESQLIKYDTVEEYHKALTAGCRNGGVAAIFDGIPYIKVFLAKYGSNFMMAGPIYSTDGFGFAFPKNSPLVSNFSRAILKVREERKKMDEIEKKYFGQIITYPRVDPHISTDGPKKLHASSLAGLFIMVGIGTLFALFMSKRYIWSKLIELAKQYSTRYFSSQPSNGTQLVAQSTTQVNSTVETHDVEDSVGNSESILVQTRDNNIEEDNEVKIQVHFS